jgi:hypothetical protein
MSHPAIADQIDQIRSEIEEASSLAECNGLARRIEELARHHGPDWRDDKDHLLRRLKVVRGRITRRYDARLEAIRAQRFELARQRAEELPAQMEPLLRAGRFAEAAALARFAAEPFMGTDQPEAFFEPWWTCAELMGELHDRIVDAARSGLLSDCSARRRVPGPIVASAVAEGSGQTVVDQGGGGRAKTRLAWDEPPPNVLCRWAAEVTDPKAKDQLLALGLLYLYRAADLKRAAECLRRAEKMGCDCSWSLAALARASKARGAKAENSK